MTPERTSGPNPRARISDTLSPVAWATQRFSSCGLIDGSCLLKKETLNIGRSASQRRLLNKRKQPTTLAASIRWGGVNKVSVKVASRAWERIAPAVPPAVAEPVPAGTKPARRFPARSVQQQARPNAGQRGRVSGHQAETDRPSRARRLWARHVKRGES